MRELFYYLTVPFFYKLTVVEHLFIMNKIQLSQNYLFMLENGTPGGTTGSE